jgi:hypothetical protein
MLIVCLCIQRINFSNGWISPYETYNVFRGTSAHFDGVIQISFSFCLWGGTKSTRYCGHFWPIVQAPDDRWGWLWSNWWNEDWQGKTEVLGENLLQRHFVHHKSHMTRPRLEPGPPRWEASLSYGAAALIPLISLCVYMCIPYRCWATAR